MLATLTSIDYGVIAFYMLAMVGLGFYFANEQRTTQDFFLGGRSFSWFPLGMSLMATLISALSYTGLPGQAYEYGLRCLILPLTVWLALPIMVGVVLPIFRGLGLYSLYEYFELRFDSRTRLAGSLIFVVWRMLWLGGVIYAPCKVLVIASGTDIPEWVLISLLGAVTTFYTFLGGMKAVVWTDVIQGMAMLGGVVVVILGVWWQTAGGHERVTEVASGLGRLQPASFALDWGSAWYLWGALPHWFLANLSFYAADQITAQRFLSAKSVDAARTSYLLNCIVLTLLQPGLIYVGLCMLTFYQDHPQEMHPNWVASLDNKTREVVKDKRGRLLLDPKHHPEEEISLETIDQLVQDGKLLKPNTLEPYAKSAELVDRDAGKVLVEKLLIRRPPNDQDMSEVVVRQGAPEEMLPRFIADHLPWGAAGLMMAALVAACMSSITASLNSICTLLVMDFHRRYGIGRAWLAKRLEKTPDTLNQSDELKLAQPLTLAVGVGATLFAIGVAQVRDIFEIMVAIANTFGAPLLAVFLLGMFTRRCTGAGAFFGLITGSLLTVGITVLSLLKKYGYVPPEIWPFHDIWTVTFGVLFTLIAGYGSSLILGKAKSRTQLRGLVWGVGHLGVLAADEEVPILGDIDPEAGAVEMNRFWNAAREFVAQPLREAREEQLRHLAAEPGGRLDGQTMVMLVSVAVLLTLQYYYVTSGSSPIEPPIRHWLEECFAAVPALRYDDRGELSRLGYWSLGNFVLYVAIPAMVVLGIFRQPLSQFGLKLRGWHQNWWVYVAFYLLLFPAVVLASQWQSFQSKYPFYRLHHGESLGPRFYVWELLYAVQFLSLEFFFRGYMIQAGRKRLGPYVIFVMTVPYCMIHFGKPVQETLGAIVAGVLLGFLALKTRSIWLGAALHIAVAWTMDALALRQK